MSWLNGPVGSAFSSHISENGHAASAGGYACAPRTDGFPGIRPATSVRELRADMEGRIETPCRNPPGIGPKIIKGCAMSSPARGTNSPNVRTTLWAKWCCFLRRSGEATPNVTTMPQHGRPAMYELQGYPIRRTTLEAESLVAEARAPVEGTTRASQHEDHEAAARCGKIHVVSLHMKAVPTGIASAWRRNTMPIFLGTFKQQIRRARGWSSDCKVTRSR